MAEVKKIDNEDLEKVDGGKAAAFEALRHNLQGMLPEDVRQKVREANGDVETCRVLAENGIDVEQIEKKIKKAGFNLNKIGLQELPDEELDKIAGGFETDGINIKCRCGAVHRSCFSYQIIDTMFSYDFVRNIWRCKNCNLLIRQHKDGMYDFLNPQTKQVC